jgi:hypothetical protein
MPFSDLHPGRYAEERRILSLYSPRDDRDVNTLSTISQLLLLDPTGIIHGLLLVFTMIPE